MPDDIGARYRGYIACLNAQDWAHLGEYVGDEVTYNGERLGLCGYRKMLEGDFEAIPDLSFNIAFIVCESPFVASRLDFDCTPSGTLFDLPVNGKRIQFSENVFYEFSKDRVQRVWSVIDKAAIAAQL